jgi:hypothetical protein
MTNTCIDESAKAINHDLAVEAIHGIASIPICFMMNTWFANLEVAPIHYTNNLRQLALLFEL